MELPYTRMGEIAARMMLADVRGRKAPPEAPANGARITVCGELRWRQSVVQI
jgi:hypothetical protein